MGQSTGEERKIQNKDSKEIPLESQGFPSSTQVRTDQCMCMWKLPQPRKDLPETFRGKCAQSSHRAGNSVPSYQPDWKTP